MTMKDVLVNGVTIPEAPGAGGDEVRSITLPSGRTAAIRKGFGRDLMRAQRAAGTAADDPAAVMFALIAELSEIGGRRIVYEDVLAMELGDVLALQAEVTGANFQLPPPPPSPAWSTSDSK